MNFLRYVLAKGLHRTSLEIALDLIFATTEIEFPADKVIFGIPQAIDVRPDIDTDPNTYIPVKWVADGFDYRYNPPADEGVLSNRIPLTLLTPLEEIEFKEPIAFKFTIHSILDKINAKLNAQLTKDDVVDIAYEGNNDFIIVRASYKSLVWISELQIWFDGKENTDDGRITENYDLRITEDNLIRALET